MIARIFFFRAAPVFFHLLLFGCRGGTSTGLDAGPEDTGISLVVQSTPEGATILLDGEYVGTTPDTLTELAQGNYVLGLSLSGYSDYSTHLVIRDSTVGPVAATLSALCSGQVIGDPARPAEIEFTDLNPGDRRVV